MFEIIRRDNSGTDFLKAIEIVYSELYTTETGNAYQVFVWLTGTPRHPEYLAEANAGLEKSLFRTKALGQTNLN